MSPKRLETGRIAPSELGFLLIGFMMGSSILLTPGSAAGHDVWAAIIVGTVGALGVALVWVRLSARFPGRTFVAICREVYGRFVGSAIGLAFSWYLFHLASLVLTNFGDYYSGTILRRTPEAAALALGLLLATYAVTGGIEVLARCSIPIVVIMVAVFAMDTLLLAPHIDVRRLLPLFEAPPAVFAWAALGSATFPLGEAAVFLMIFPTLTDRRGLKRIVLGTIVLAGIAAAGIMARNAAVLGRTIRLYPYIDIQAVRMIDIGGLLTRLEMLISGLAVGTGFIKFGVLMYGCAVGLSEVFGLSTYRPLVHPLGALLLILALLNFNSVYENIRFAVVTYPLYGLFFQLLLPSATLLLAMLRRLPSRPPGRGQRAKVAAD